MGKSCFDGYLTPACADCAYWRDGSNGSNGAFGCETPFPIMHCPAFAKMVEEDEQQARKEELSVNVNRAKKYFNRTGKIYGVSVKFEFGRWSGYAVAFDDFDEAERWLHTEEYDFRERELVSKTEARRWGLKGN